MFSIFKKISNLFKSEVRILEEFIEKHTVILANLEKEVHKIPHIRNEESDHLVTLVYRITREEVEILKKELWHICDKIVHEEGLWYMGNIMYSNRTIGFYFGMSYELEHEWARFWFE